MKAIKVYAEEKQLDYLRKLSASSGAPLAELIRRAVDQYLAVELFKTVELHAIKKGKG